MSASCRSFAAPSRSASAPSSVTSDTFASRALDTPVVSSRTTRMSVLKLASARLVAESAACKRASLAATRDGGGSRRRGRAVSVVRSLAAELFGSLASSEGWDAAMPRLSLRMGDEAIVRPLCWFGVSIQHGFSSVQRHLAPLQWTGSSSACARGRRVSEGPSPSERVRLLSAIKRRFHELAPRFVELDCRAKGIPLQSPRSGECGFEGPAITLRYVAELERSVGGERTLGPASLRVEDGKTRVRAVPRDVLERVLAPGVEADVWLNRIATVDRRRAPSRGPSAAKARGRGRARARRRKRRFHHGARRASAMFRPRARVPPQGEPGQRLPRSALRARVRAARASADAFPLRTAVRTWART